MTIETSRFVNNTMQIALFNINSAKLFVKDSFFFDNMAQQLTNGFQVSESELSFVRSKIDNCMYRDCAEDKTTSRRLSAVEEFADTHRHL